MKRITTSIAAYLHAPFAPEHRFASVLAALVVARWVMVVLLMLDVPHLHNHVPLWFFHTGGDQQSYFNLAQGLAEGHIRDEKISLGSALVMVPFVWLFDAAEYRDVVAPLLIINGLLLGGLSVALAGLTGRQYTGDGRVGLASAGLWLLLPAFVYAVVGLHPAAESLRGTLLPKIMWLTGISDGPAIFGILLGVWALGLAREQDNLRAYFLAGLGFGWAVMARIQVAPVVALVLGVVALARAWRGLWWMCLGGLVGYLPQAVLNTSLYGIPFYTGYLRTLDVSSSLLRRPVSQILRELPYSPSGIASTLTFFVERYPWIAPLLVLSAAVGLVVFVALWRKRGWFFPAILLGVPIANLVAGVSVYFFASDPVRFTMLSYPYLLAGGAFFAWLVWDKLRAMLSLGGDRSVPVASMGNSSLEGS